MKGNFLGSLALSIGLILTITCTENPAIVYRIILPDRYIGWVRVDFAGTTAPSIDSANVITFRVGEDGTCRTSAVMTSSIPRTKYEFFYDTPAGLRPVQEDFVDRRIDAGGITAGSEDPHYGISWFFFVGPKSYRQQHPNRAFTSHSSPMPTPGRLPAQAR